jgi:glycosyltransferase involved in cell wall biosynthesis
MKAAVTVAIPAHGSPAQVLELLRALAAQVPAGGGGRLPVVVADDCSPEALAPVLEAAAPAELELRVVRTARNGGPGAARNRALDEVATPWVAFIDADELPGAGWLERLRQLIADPDGVDVIVGRVAIPTAAGPFEHATEAIAEEQQYVAGNVVFRTPALRDDGGFDERFYDPSRRLHFREDAELRFRLEAAGRRFVYAPDLVVEHPPLPSSVLAPARLARRYYFDPLLAREHPERFRAFVRSRRVGPVPLRRARHDAALLFAGGGLAAVVGSAAGARSLRRAGLAGLLAGWALNAAALGWGRRVRARHVVPMAGLAAVTPLVYLWHFYRGVLTFRHLPRW